MKQKSLLTFLIATAMIGSFSACVDSEKDLRDSSFQMSNPMGEGFAAPDDFDWNMVTSVKATVNVNDTKGGQYFYGVELYDANPIISPDAHLLDKGAAKKGEPYESEIVIEKTNKTIFVKEIAPNGLFTVKAVDIINGVANCDFTTPSSPVRASRSLAMTRSVAVPDGPDEEDTSLFPDKCPEGLEVFKGYGFTAGESYKVTSSTTSINLGGTTNIKLYVTENITLSSLYLTEGSSLYILPNASITIHESKNNGQKNCTISISRKASFIVEEKMQLDNNYKLYNLGTFKAHDLTYTNQSLFYNGSEGNVIIEDDTEGENANCTLINAGNFKTEDFKVEGQSHAINYGKMEVVNETKVNCTSGSWVNEGTWLTKEMSLSANNKNNFNACKLIVSDELEIEDAMFTNDGGAFVKCTKLEMERSTVNLGAKSLFKVTEEAKFKDNTSNKGFKGTGADKALLIIKKAITEYPANGNMIHYSGNLQIICSDHPDAKIDDWNTRWTMSEDVEWTEEGKNTISIPSSECNEGYNQGTQTKPESDPFPIIVEDKKEYSYLFEDQWPLYGDYDMNDLVLTIKKREISKNNKGVKEFKLRLELKAVGATKNIGAAIMFDDVLASSITKPVEIEEKNLLTNFNLTNMNIEKDQVNAVIPLFSDAHMALGRNIHQPINTISGNENNTKNTKEISFTIKFDTPLDPEAFNINKLNVFIIVDGNKANNRREIHIAGYRPTQLAETSSFGGNNDGSSVSAERYYVSKENLAWGIMVPTNFKWPLEYTNIKDAYSGFEEWVTSGGQGNKNWWNHFHVGKVFQTNKN